MRANKRFLHRAISVLLGIAMALGGATVWFGLLTKSSSPVLSSGERSPLTQSLEETNVTLNEISPEMRGVWIATVGNINYPSSPTASAITKKKELDSILQNSKDLGCNAIFFQVRPAADALYNSDIFPVSLFFDSDRTLSFDPLAYLCTQAKKQDIAVYAWVNPLRITYGKQTYDTLPADHPAKLHADWTFCYNGSWWFDPGVEQVRQLVANGVKEIAENYDVQGIVFDDYFYPYPATDDNGNSLEIDDGDTYALFGKNKEIGTFRRENVNQMIAICHKTVLSANDNIAFGVSPFGIWRNDNGSNGGSATQGLSSYDSLYCDPLQWIKDGTVDFLAPQLYWTTQSEIANFNVLANWWNEQVKGTSIRLYFSQAAYQYSNWNLPGEMQAQLDTARPLSSFRGSVLYGYAALCSNTGGVATDVREAFSGGRYFYYSK